MTIIEREGFRIERHSYVHRGLRLRATVMRPSGQGPFPVVVWNHNSRIRIVDGAFLDETQEPTVADADNAYPGVLDKQWMWFFPECRGYAGSDGTRLLSLASAGPPAVVEYLKERAADSLAGVDWLLSRADVMPEHMAIAGASHGGTVTLLAAAMRRAAFGSVVVQAPGVWTGMVTPGLDEMKQALRSISVPVLFQHFRGDGIVPLEVSQVLLQECRKIGKRDARLAEYDPIPGVDSHFQFLPGNYERMLPDLVAELEAGLRRGAAGGDASREAEPGVLRC